MGGEIIEQRARNCCLADAALVRADHDYRWLRHGAPSLTRRAATALPGVLRRPCQERRIPFTSRLYTTEARFGSLTRVCARASAVCGADGKSKAPIVTRLRLRAVRTPRGPRADWAGPSFSRRCGAIFPAVSGTPGAASRRLIGSIIRLDLPPSPPESGPTGAYCADHALEGFLDDKSGCNRNRRLPAKPPSGEARSPLDRLDPLRKSRSSSWMCCPQTSATVCQRRATATCSKVASREIIVL